MTSAYTPFIRSGQTFPMARTRGLLLCKDNGYAATRDAAMTALAAARRARPYPADLMLHCCIRQISTLVNTPENDDASNLGADRTASRDRVSVRTSAFGQSL